MRILTHFFSRTPTDATETKMGATSRVQGVGDLSADTADKWTHNIVSFTEPCVNGARMKTYNDGAYLG